MSTVPARPDATTDSAPRSDLGRVRPGDRVRLYYVCHATLSGVAKPMADGGLVLDIPGDNFVVRHADGRPADGVERVVVTEPA